MPRADLDVDGAEYTQLEDEPQAEEQRAECRRLAEQIWSSALPAPDNHPYLILWGVRAAHGLREYRGDLSIDGVRCDGMLLMRMLDATRTLQNVAFISIRGERYYLHCGIAGLYCGWAADRRTIVIAVGFVRAVKVYEETGHAVAVAFTEVNVANVVGIMLERYPASRIILASGLNCNVHHDRPPGDADAVTDCPLDASVAANVAGASLKASRRSRRHASEQQRTERPEIAVALRPLQAPVLEDDGKRYAADQLDDAQKLLNWISRRGLTTVTRTQVMQLGPYAVRPARCARPALLILVEHGWLSSEVGATYHVTVAALAALAEQKHPTSSG